MFETLKALLAELSGRSGPAQRFADDDVRVAAAALLAHVADSDGNFSTEERQRAQALLAERFELDAAAAARLVRAGVARDHEEVGVDHFVNVLNRALNADARLKIVAMMWDVVFADGAASDVEEAIIWRIAEMLKVSPADRETLRRSRIPD